VFTYDVNHRRLRLKDVWGAVVANGKLPEVPSALKNAVVLIPRMEKVWIIVV